MDTVSPYTNVGHGAWPHVLVDVIGDSRGHTIDIVSIAGLESVGNTCLVEAPCSGDAVKNTMDTHVSLVDEDSRKVNDGSDLCRAGIIDEKG